MYDETLNQLNIKKTNTNFYDFINTIKGKRSMIYLCKILYKIRDRK